MTTIVQAAYIVSALLFIMAVIGMAVWDYLKGILRLGKQPSQQLFVLHASIAVVIGALVGGIFEYNLGDSEVLMMFTSVIGLGYAALPANTESVSK